MPHTVVAGRGAPAVRAMLIALLVTALVLGMVALVVWAWPDADESTVTADFRSYTAGNPPVMGDVHYTPPIPAGFGSYEPGSPPSMRDPQARSMS